MLASPDPDLDFGPRTEKSATRRMCAVSREVRPIEELIRFVVAPTGEVVADIKRKLPGRGLWVTASRQAVAEAVRRHHFPRGFKRDLRVPPTLATDIEALLVRSVTDALAIAAKAGQVVAQFSKVEAALKERGSRNTVQALIHAADGAPDGIRKLDAQLGQECRAKYRDRGGIHADSRHHSLNFGRIGFGTYPLKCDTCSAARGPGEQDLPVAQPDPGPIPDGRRRQDSRNRCQEFETAFNVAFARWRRLCNNKRCAFRATRGTDWDDSNGR